MKLSGYVVAKIGKKKSINGDVDDEIGNGIDHSKHML
jgi:hypothetical protein